MEYSGGIEKNGLKMCLICLMVALLASPALLRAEPCTTKTTTGIVDNDNGTYSIAGTFTRNELSCVNILDEKAEEFCSKDHRYYVFVERAAGIPTWELTFKCITDENEAKRLKRIHETLLD